MQYQVVPSLFYDECEVRIISCIWSNQLIVLRICVDCCIYSKFSHWHIDYIRSSAKKLLGLRAVVFRVHVSNDQSLVADGLMFQTHSRALGHSSSLSLEPGWRWVTAGLQHIADPVNATFVKLVALGMGQAFGSKPFIIFLAFLIRWNSLIFIYR